MRHLDLFSGIGGFALATEMVWEDVEHIFCDNDPFAQAILRKHWPNSHIYGDIKNLTADTIKSFHKEGPVDILTGGFPCQPFSAAGRRRGTEDDRHLWPEMLRIIRETRPTIIVGENVSGLLTWDEGVVFEQVCTDLEGEGYEVQAFVIPACGLNAPHRRDRVWIVAYAKDAHDRGNTGKLSSSNERKAKERQKERTTELGGADSLRNAPHTTGVGSGRSTSEERRVSKRILLTGESKGSPVRSKGKGCPDYAPNATGTRLQRAGKNGKGRGGQRDRARSSKRRSWSENWPEVATELCTVDDGLPGGLVRPKGWRNAALKGAGNAIVPQVAAEIMRAMT